MLKVTTLIASLLAAPLAFSASAQPLTDVEYISVSAVSATPSMLEADESPNDFGKNH